MGVKNQYIGKFDIEERRRLVASMLAQAMSETEIADRLGVDVSTICRDIKVLREMSQQFVFDLAKSDLAYYYKNCIAGIEEVQRKAWEMFNNYNSKYGDMTPKDKILALRLAKDCNVSKFDLFDKGPSVMNLKSLSDRLDKMEGRNLPEKPSEIN